MLAECMAVKILKNKDAEIISALNNFDPTQPIPPSHQLIAQPHGSRKRDQKSDAKLAADIAQKGESKLCSF